MDYGVPGRDFRPTEDQAAHLLNRVLDLGVNFIDTARVYGTSEEVIGRALAARRNEYILASKVAAPPAGLQSTGQELRRWVADSITTSLRALQTDVIDLLQIHSATLEVIQRGEIIEAIADAQKVGSVRFTGATTYGEPATLAAIEDGRYDCVQVAYNLLDRQFETQVLPLARQKDVGVVVRSVLLRGVLSDAYVHLPAQLDELRAAIGRLAALPVAPCVPEMAYRYVLAQPAIASALVGTARLDELEAALDYASRGPLPEELVDGIRQIVVHDEAQLFPGNWPRPEAWQSPG